MAGIKPGAGKRVEERAVWDCARQLLAILPRVAFQCLPFPLLCYLNNVERVEVEGREGSLGGYFRRVNLRWIET